MMAGWLRQVSCGILLAAFGGIASGADACSCILSSTSEMLARSTAVFIGRVVEVGPLNREEGVPMDARTTVLEVEHAWKGANATRVSVRSTDQESACGVKFKAGESYLVFAFSNPNRTLTTSSCDLTKLLSTAMPDLKVMGAPARSFTLPVRQRPEGSPPEPPGGLKVPSNITDPRLGRGRWVGVESRRRQVMVLPVNEAGGLLYLSDASGQRVAVEYETVTTETNRMPGGLVSVEVSLRTKPVQLIIFGRTTPTVLTLTFPKDGMTLRMADPKGVKPATVFTFRRETPKPERKAASLPR